MPRTRTDKGPSERLTLEMPSDLCRALRIISAADGPPINHLVAQATRAWLRDRLSSDDPVTVGLIAAIGPVEGLEL